MSERTCRHCDGTGVGAGFAACVRCRGSGNAPQGEVPRPRGIDERRRLAPTDAQLRHLHRLVCEGDHRDPAVVLASDALGRSDVDRTTINAHIAAVSARRPAPPLLHARRPRARPRRRDYGGDRIPTAGKRRRRAARVARALARLDALGPLPEVARFNRP